ncbi:MAG: hypothetical protein OQJ78_05755, partial [Ignavibacteriaceae bacterium]|nr:hypothetical protein [Ignavibacteriaceae bacterium]
MHNKIILILFSFSLFAHDLSELEKQSASYKDRIKTCEIQGVPYFYTGNASVSGRASLAMALSAVLSPEIVTVRDLNLRPGFISDDPTQFFEVIQGLGVDNARYKRWGSRFDLEKEELQKEISLGRPVILTAYTGFINHDDVPNKILLVGYDSWG